MASNRLDLLHCSNDQTRHQLPPARPKYHSDSLLAQDKQFVSLNKFLPRYPPQAHITKQQRCKFPSVSHYLITGRTSHFEKYTSHASHQHYPRLPPIAHTIESNIYEYEPNPPIGRIRDNITGVLRDWKPEDGDPEPLQSGETRYRDFVTEPANVYKCECYSCSQRNPPVGQIRNNITGVVRRWKPEDGEPDSLQEGETRYRDFAVEPSKAYSCQCATCTNKGRHNPSKRMNTKNEHRK
ncbi:hypothetical protein BZA77DRAFT_322763 [Pyronema omphalodes]|nr:hypothetical protein BZA77DRAFT_322763 [Pyronema omphalodes]